MHTYISSGHTQASAWRRPIHTTLAVLTTHVYMHSSGCKVIDDRIPKLVALATDQYVAGKDGGLYYARAATRS